MRSKMKGIDSTGAHLVHVPGWMDGWVDGWIGGADKKKLALTVL
jgi:hypothetical protein